MRNREEEEEEEGEEGDQVYLRASFSALVISFLVLSGG